MMKKYIFAILAAMLVFVLSGCGSNSKSDGTGGGSGTSPSTPGLSITGGKVKVDDKQNFSLDLIVEKTAGSEYQITLSDFELGILGCDVTGETSYTPDPLVLEGNDKLKVLKITGKLDGVCSSLGYGLKATETITKGGQTKVQAINYVGNGGIEVLSGFFNASTPLTITQPQTTYEISVQVVKQGHIVVGQAVNLRPFNRTYGYSTSYSTVTGEDGYAKFSYISPDTLPADGETVTLKLDMQDEEAGKTVTQDIVLTFKKESPIPPVDTTGYVLNVVPAAINISKPMESVGIDLQLLNGNNPVKNQVIIVHAFSISNGRMADMKVETDNVGVAHFTYIAPAQLPNNSLDLVFEVEGGTPVLQKSVNVVFGGTPPVDTANYTIQAVPSQFTIGGAGESKTISLYVVNTATQAPVPNITVKADWFNPVNGTLNAYSITTNANGQAVFNYTAPDVLPTNGFNITFKFDNATNPKPTNVAVAFGGSSNPPVNTANYAIQAVPAQFTIGGAGESKTINLYVVDTTTQSPVPNITVKADWFDPSKGTLSKYTVTTNANGQAVFNYTAPDVLPTTGFNITFKFDNATNPKPTNVSVSFASGGQYNLTNVTTPITVNYDDELKVISVDVVNQNGIGVSGVSVSITAVNGIENGSIISASTVQSDASGHAQFTYKAPSDVGAVDGTSTNLTLSMVDNGTTITRNVVITFNKINTVSLVPIVVIDSIYKDINITQNNQNVQMVVRVFEEGTNNPYTQGNVKVSLPNEVLNGVDVGSFSEYTVPVGSNGQAVFNYTGPQDIQDLLNSGHTGATFDFSHEGNPTQGESIAVTYNLTTGYIPANYILSTSSEDGEQTVGLNTFKSFTLYLKNDQGTFVDNADITQVTIESKNTLIGKLVDAANGGAVVDTLVFNGNDAINSQPFTIQTNTLSGLLPIEITVTFDDANGDSRTLSTIMNVVVLSGPPTAMSIVYAGVEQNEATAKYIEKFVVTVTDAYNNAVNTRPYISVGGMVEYAVDGSSLSGNRTETSPRLWHGLYDSRGTIDAVGGNKAQFAATQNNVFQYIDMANDKLVVFGAGYVYEALGKWDIASVTGNDDTLELVDDYYGDDRDNLFYAVGHNNRQDLCSSGIEYIGNMKANTYQLDDTGHAFISFEYDYHLTGKDIMIWANLTGFQADNNHTGRIGEAQKHTLRGYGFVSNDSYTLAAGATDVIKKFRVHHENAPEWYQNGHFGFSTTGTCQVNGIVDWSNLHDARECTNIVSYVELNITNPIPLGSCVISIDGIAVSPEFTGVSSY